MEITKRETLTDCLRIFQADMKRFGTESSGGLSAKPGLEIPHERAMKEYRIIQKIIQELEAGKPIREERRPPAEWQKDGREREILNVEDYLPKKGGEQLRII